MVKNENYEAQQFTQLIKWCVVTYFIYDVLYFLVTMYNNLFKNILDNHNVASDEKDDESVSSVGKKISDKR